MDDLKDMLRRRLGWKDHHIDRDSLRMAKQHGSDAGKDDANVTWTGLARFQRDELTQALRSDFFNDAKKFDGWEAIVNPRLGQAFLMPKPNLVVDKGVQRALDRLFAINSTPAAIATIGVDNGTVSPNANFLSSTNGDGTTGSSSSRRIIAFDSAATRSGNVVSATGTLTQATVAFIMKRLFFSAAAAGTTDANGDLHSMTNVFTVDYTGFTTWTQSFTGQLTGAGS